MSCFKRRAGPTASVRKTSQLNTCFMPATNWCVQWASFRIDLIKAQLDPMLSAVAVSELSAHVQCNSVMSEIPGMWSF